MTKEREGEVLAVGLTIIESWFPILSIASMAYIGAINTYMFSLIVALLFFIVLVVKRGKLDELKNKAAYKDLLLTSFWITTVFLLVFVGMQYTTAGNMAVIVFLQLLFAYLYFNVFGKEKMHAIHTLGAVLMGVGALVVLMPEEFVINRGDFIILIGSMVMPFANLYQKRAREYCSAESILLFRTVVGLPFVALLAYLFEPAVSYENLQKAFPYIVLIGTVVYVVSKIMWIEALHRISITKLSAMLGLIPMMTLVFAYFYLHEIPNSKQMIGIIPILIGGYFITKPIKNNDYTA